MAKITTSNLNNTLNTRITAGETALAAVANVVSLAITSVQIANSSYAVLDDTAANTSGTSYLVVNGSGFTSDCIVIVGATNASSTTFANSKQLRAAVAGQNAASYPVYVTDTATGATATKINGLTFSSFPVWGTANTLTNVTSNTAFSTLLSANSDSSVIYSNTTILPTGTALLSNGYFYGNISVGATTTYSFDVKATDAELQDSNRTFNLNAVNGFIAEYLVVAGGGGAINSAGGGAGGLLFGSTLLGIGSSYTITVGSGGSAGVSGSSSNIKQSGTTIVSTTGGGFGKAFGDPGPQRFGVDGGSGGGGSHANVMSPTTYAGGNATDYPGPTQQGFPGGFGFNQAGGGGGGAGSSGSPATNPAGTVPGGIGGNGGNGITWPYTGTTYAGGGGGFGYLTGVGTGGTGGGGNATPYTLSPDSGVPGTNGLGGGAGGGGNAGSSGGSGVVILAIPTPLYPGSAPGATVTTPPAAPGKTIVTFTSSGTYTA